MPDTKTCDKSLVRSWAKLLWQKQQIKKPTNQKLFTSDEETGNQNAQANPMVAGVKKKSPSKKIWPGIFLPENARSLCRIGRSPDLEHLRRPSQQSWFVSGKRGPGWFDFLTVAGTVQVFHLVPFSFRRPLPGLQKPNPATKVLF
jgi:hypothetical protein